MPRSALRNFRERVKRHVRRAHRRLLELVRTRRLVSDRDWMKWDEQ